VPSNRTNANYEAESVAGDVSLIGLMDGKRRDTYIPYTNTTTTKLHLFATDVARRGKEIFNRLK
jgi:hypothetical protein